MAARLCRAVSLASALRRCNGRHVECKRQRKGVGRVVQAVMTRAATALRASLLGPEANCGGGGPPLEISAGDPGQTIGVLDDVHDHSFSDDDAQDMRTMPGDRSETGRDSAQTASDRHPSLVDFDSSIRSDEAISCHVVTHGRPTRARGRRVSAGDGGSYTTGRARTAARDATATERAVHRFMDCKTPVKRRC